MIRQSIPFSGIDTSALDKTVPDGACADILNMRVRNGALHHVCAPEVLYTITQTNGWTIVHKMECLAANEYVAIKQEYWNSVRISVVVIVDDSINEAIDENFFTKSLGWFPGTSSEYSIWSFGTVLYVNKGVGEALEERTFVFKDGTFAEFDLGGIEPPQFDIEMKYMHATWPNVSGVHVPINEYDPSTGKVKEVYNVHIDKLKAGGYIVGLFSVMVAYVMHDGTVVKPSAPRYVSSNQDRDELTLSQHISPGGITYTDVVEGVKATVRLTANAPDALGLIKCARVFVTRATPIWNYADIQSKFQDDTPTGYTYRSRIVNKDALDLNQPFYELCDINKRDLLSEPITSVNLNEDIVHGVPYKASFSNHNISGGGKFEYNNRVHQYGIRTEYASGYRQDAKQTEGDPAYLVLRAKIETGLGESVYVQKRSEIRLGSIVSAHSRIAVIPNLLVYPHAGVESFELIVTDRSGRLMGSRTVVPKISLANNMAYCFMSEDTLYNNIPVDAETIVGNVPGEQVNTGDTTATSYEPSKLLVSRLNNPFVFAPENTYLIGEQGSSITALQTATEQVSETRFGAFPLYAFTDRAIYALEVGQGEVLYSAVVGIGNDRKLPETTTVGAANLVFFVSDQGVMALEGRYAVCISHPLDTLPPEMPFDVPFEQYAAGALLDYNPTENELRVYNPAHDYAFVYSLDSKLWTRRTWSGRHVSPWQLITGDGIASASKEQSVKPLSEVQLVTRPLKLGSTEYKRIETIVARLDAGGATTYKITLEGSNDLRAWSSLVTVTNARMLRRSMSSYLYHRVRIEASVFDWLQATHLDAEFYTRFVRRLR